MASQSAPNGYWERRAAQNISSGRVLCGAVRWKGPRSCRFSWGGPASWVTNSILEIFPVLRNEEQDGEEDKRRRRQDSGVSASTGLRGDHEDKYPDKFYERTERTSIPPSPKPQVLQAIRERSGYMFHPQREESMGLASTPGPRAADLVGIDVDTTDQTPHQGYPEYVVAQAARTPHPSAGDVARSQCLLRLRKDREWTLLGIVRVIRSLGADMNWGHVWPPERLAGNEWPRSPAECFGKPYPSLPPNETPASTLGAYTHPNPYLDSEARAEAYPTLPSEPNAPQASPRESTAAQNEFRSVWEIRRP
ncbi:hypothetical protein FA13DRAFT_1875404 [Coprinellus micaceus]|uniref:Uncharacterized protein n=1 Tax=Coprinellus micaceus TaxID=71717 RepID=A0A4Y7T261_COPMI|nr:hypothetical protein FA13DRAFT_1875404 [Coprinellus micaceus]